MNSETDFLVHVIKDYQAPYPDPIQAKSGDEVSVDRSKKTDMTGWVWCTNGEGKSGWVPKTYVEINEDRGRMLQNYNAIELTIHVGEILIVHKTESSFYWATSPDNQQGWIPIANVEAMEEET